MAATSAETALDTPAAEFWLAATDGKTYALDDVAGEKGTVIVFICNHCPYVKAVIDRMVSDARVLMSESNCTTSPRPPSEDFRRDARHGPAQRPGLLRGHAATPGRAWLPIAGQMTSGCRISSPGSSVRPAVGVRPDWQTAAWMAQVRN